MNSKLRQLIFSFHRYKWLDKAYVGTGAKIVVKKMLIDQFIMTPPFYVVFFVSKCLKYFLIEMCLA